MIDTAISESLQTQFSGQVKVLKRRDNLFQVYAPVFHEDGDPLEVFVSEKPGKPGVLTFSDQGITLMRLSYEFEIDTPNKERVFEQILAENRIENDDGNLTLETPATEILPAFLQFCQAIAKVSSLHYLKRETVSRLFFEMVTEFVMDDLASFRPEKDVSLIPDREELAANFVFRGPELRIPIVLFAVRGKDSAHKATIISLDYQRSGVRFLSHVVHDEIERLPKKERRFLTSAVDKQYVNFEDFKNNAAEVMRREAAA